MIFKNKEKEKVKQLLYDQSLENPSMFPIDLSEKEQNFLVENLKGVDNYLEFGSGGSTFLTISRTNVKKIVSVESDINWIEHLRNWEIIKKQENHRLFFNHIDIGKTGSWGFPVDENMRHLYPNYSHSPFEELNDNYGLILIDGRFRVACALQAILNCSSDTKILIDDFNDRPQYHSLLKFLEIIEPMDVMSSFKIRNNINKEDLLIEYEKYKYNPE